MAVGRIPSEQRAPSDTIPSIQTGGAIYEIFRLNGDTENGRIKATRALTNILRFYYGDAYEYRYFGKSVDLNGYITKAFVDRYNYLVDTAGKSSSQAMAEIEASGSVNISFVKTENPRYVNPWYLEYRIRPYDITDKHLFLPLGLQNLKFRGCKLNGTSINANSAETTDGGPVVKVTLVNQNQIVFSNNNITTARSNTSGLPVRQLTSKDFNAGSGRVSETVSQAPQA
jgi:hypothetical protein